jgi:hypothetical protein
VQSLVQLCEAKLGLRPAKAPRSALPAPTSPAAHPLQLLVRALQAQAAGPSASSSMSAARFREQRAADARAAGHAAAFLLHPSVYAAAVGGNSSSSSSSSSSSGGAGPLRYLVGEAVSVLTTRGKAAFSAASMSTLLGGSAAAAGGSGGGGGGAGNAALQERAGKSKVLQELLQMTGLEPVKLDMLDLANQVRVVRGQRGTPTVRGQLGDPPSAGASQT